MIECVLQRATCFQDLSADEIADIARHAGERRLAPGEALFAQGEPADRFFLVASGRLKVAMITLEGKQVMVRLIHPGDFCGLALALARPDYPATCRALVSVHAIVWPIDYWARLIEAHPRVAVGVTRALGRHIEDVHNRMAELATEEVEQRVAKTVLRLAHQAGRPGEGGVCIDFPVTCQDIAEMAGTTLHSVSRIVSGWSHRGIIARGRARIVVRDLPALERIARGQDA